MKIEKFKISAISAYLQIVNFPIAKKLIFDLQNRLHFFNPLRGKDVLHKDDLIFQYSDVIFFNVFRFFKQLPVNSKSSSPDIGQNFRIEPSLYFVVTRLTTRALVDNS